jgi:hypothetical protein
MTVSHGYSAIRIPTSDLDMSVAESGITEEQGLRLSIKPPSDYVCPIIVSIADWKNLKLEPPHFSILVRGDVTGEAGIRMLFCLLGCLAWV